MKESDESGQKEFHGCMGTLMHLFDFNHAFSPRKMLPSHNCCHEVENRVEKPVEAIKCSSDGAEKKRMPNVVARLMGLDAMPNHDPNSVRKQSVGVCMMEKYPPKLSKSRSVNTLSETFVDSVEQNKLQFRSRSFREHHPQEKQLQDFKNDFEASQERRNLMQKSHDRSASFDSQKTFKQKQKQESKEFLDALEFLQNNDKIFLRALHNPNSMVSMQIHRPKVPSMTSPSHPILSSNPVNPSLAKIVVAKPGNAKHTNQELRGCRGEAKQISKGASTELRNGRVILPKRVKKSEDKCTRKVCKEMDCSHSTSSIRTGSLANTSESGGGALPNTSKISSRPRVRKDMTQFSKEERNAPYKEQFQCPRGSDKKKPLLKSCSVTSHNVDVCDRIATSLTTSHSSNGKSVAGSPKKSSHPGMSMSKAKLQNQNSESAFVLTDKKERTTHLTEGFESAQVVPNNHTHINRKQEIESSPEKYHVVNKVDVACNAAVGGIGGNSEFPSPVSVLDGPFQHESPMPSPVHMKEVATDFHELSSKLCSLNLNRDNSVNPDQYGQIHPEEHTLELHTDDRLPATQKEGILEKIESYILESLKLDDIFIPEGKEANFFYVRTVLASAGFTDNNILAFTRWYSPSHPIDPQVFDQLEECYHDFKTYPNMKFISRSQTYKKSKDEINRKLLFELVDEILCKKLKPFLKTRAWINQSKQNLRYMSTGNELLKEVWDDICRCPEADCEFLDDVESLVHGDMAGEVPWAGDDEDIEKVGFQVERHIFDDLMEEAIFDLIFV